MNVIPLQITEPNPAMAIGDIITIEGYYTRPPVFSVGFWKCLFFGRIGSLYFIGNRPTFGQVWKRRNLFRKREFQRYIITNSNA